MERVSGCENDDAGDDLNGVASVWIAIGRMHFRCGKPEYWRPPAGILLEPPPDVATLTPGHRAARPEGGHRSIVEWNPCVTPSGSCVINRTGTRSLGRHGYTFHTPAFDVYVRGGVIDSLNIVP